MPGKGELSLLSMCRPLMQPRMLLAVLMPGYTTGSCSACCPPGPRSFPTEPLPKPSGPSLPAITPSQGQKLAFDLAGFHKVPVWNLLSSSPAFEHVNCSLTHTHAPTPNLVPSANAMRSLSKHQGQVMASDKLFP